MLLKGQGTINWQPHREGISAEQWPGSACEEAQPLDIPFMSTFICWQHHLWGEKSKLRNILFSNLAVTLHSGASCSHVLN